MYTDEEKYITVKSYELFRMTAIKKIEKKENLGKLAQFAFSRELNDIRLMEYKENYYKHYKGYTMRFIFEFDATGRKILVYEKDTF